MSSFSGENSNSADPNAAFTVAWFLGNPGGFAVPGSVFAAARGTLSDTQPVLELTARTQLRLTVSASIQTGEAVGLRPGGTFSCTVYDGETPIGTGTASVIASPANGAVSESASCKAAYLDAPDSLTAFVPLPATYDTNRAYTMLLSH